LLVGIVQDARGGLAVYPMGKGSGSVTSFSRADGFVRIGRNTEIVENGTEVEVTLLGGALQPADLVVIGSHCIGLDRIARALTREGFSIKLLAVGSQAGLDAARRGECDVAPVHLLDSATGKYNTPFLSEGLELLRGYTRMQGVVTRSDEKREPSALMLMSPARTTRSRLRWRRGAPTGASPSRRLRARRGSASARCKASAMTS
jgi:putative molybdopterin biosynthesis protein